MTGINGNVDINSIFKEKNVIIIGPSEGVSEEAKSLDIDSFDIIVRINWHFSEPSKYGLGSRTDVIYHSLHRSQYKKSDLKEWMEKGITIMSRIEIEKGLEGKQSSRFKLIKDNFTKYDIKYGCVPATLFRKLNKELGCLVSTGVLAIIHILECDPKRLTAIGFDFYQSGYNHDSKSKNKSLLRYVKNCPHKPNKQLKGFKRIIKKYDNFVPLGKLKEILK